MLKPVVPNTSESIQINERLGADAHVIFGLIWPLPVITAFLMTFLRRRNDAVIIDNIIHMKVLSFIQTAAEAVGVNKSYMQGVASVEVDGFKQGRNFRMDFMQYNDGYLIVVLFEGYAGKRCRSRFVFNKSGHMTTFDGEENDNVDINQSG